jgi:thiosulfate dehydrogenase [quinone] large subunit
MQAGQTGPRNQQIAYALFRLTLGLDIFLHGAMRFVTGVGAWEANQARAFENTILPMPLVHGFLLTLPALEVLIGAMTIVGYYTRVALIAGAIMIFALVFGTGMRQDWTTVGSQMLYAAYYFLLIARYEDNWLAVDNAHASQRA